MQKRVKCPYCGYVMPIMVLPDAESRGVIAKCKGRNCGKGFEIKIKEGKQIK